MSGPSDKTALVVGASRGLGLGIARGFADAGAHVIALARSVPTEGSLTSPNIQTEIGDAAEENVASTLLDRYQPDALILVAGATPVMSSLPNQTWESFSVHWHADVKIAFTWLRAALRQPLAVGSRVVVISSGAAIHGSPASGGYAGAKATQRFVATYAQEESHRAALGLTVTAVLPAMTPHGEVGRQGIRGYAERSNVTEQVFLEKLGELLTPERAAAALLELVQTDPATTAPSYLLTAAGLRPLP